MLSHIVIDCGALPAPGNGTVDLSQGSLLGAVATYSCNSTFRLIGMNSRECQENETWSGEAPTCRGIAEDQRFHVHLYNLLTFSTSTPTAIDCGELEGVANGMVDTSQGGLVGAIATYTCNPSYMLVGMSTRQCQDNGAWSGEAPTCEGNHQPCKILCFPVSHKHVLHEIVTDL